MDKIERTIYKSGKVIYILKYNKEILTLKLQLHDFDLVTQDLPQFDVFAVKYFKDIVYRKWGHTL